MVSGSHSFCPWFPNLYFYSSPPPLPHQASGYQAPGSGRARRDAAARAMQGWHAQRHLGHGEVSEPIAKVCCDNNIHFLLYLYLCRTLR
jgi:hypothetical protein